MANSRNLFQHLRTTIVDPDSKREHNLFLTGLTSLPPEVYDKIKDKKISEVFSGPQEISQPLPFEEAAAYTEFREFIEVVAREMEDLNS